MEFIYPFFLCKASPTPESMMIDDIKSLAENVSDNKTMPPMAAITGTVNWIMAARVAFNPFNAAYQITYPAPDASVPDMTAANTPFEVINTGEAIKRPAIRTMGIE